MHRYDPDCRQFAREIYQALGMQWPIESKRAKRELGSFESQWQKAKQSGLSAESLSELRASAIGEAKRIAKYRKRYSRAGAVLCKIFNEKLMSRVNNLNVKSGKKTFSEKIS